MLVLNISQQLHRFRICILQQSASHSRFYKYPFYEAYR